MQDPTVRLTQPLSFRAARISPQKVSWAVKFYRHSLALPQHNCIDAVARRNDDLLARKRAKLDKTVSYFTLHP